MIGPVPLLLGPRDGILTTGSFAVVLKDVTLVLNDIAVVSMFVNF